MLVGILLVSLITIPSISASTYTSSIPDNTLVQQWRFNATYGSGDWKDQITPSGFVGFDTTKIDVNWSDNDVKIQIYTNAESTGVFVSGIGEVQLADLAIDLDMDGNYETAIIMRPVSRGNMISNPIWKTSEDFFSGTGYIYGGRFDQSAPKITIVEASGGTLLGLATVNWVTIGTNPKYRIDIILPTGINSDGQWNDFNLYWGTAQCSNDGTAGSAIVSSPPQPPTPEQKVPKAIVYDRVDIETFNLTNAPVIIQEGRTIASPGLTQRLVVIKDGKVLSFFEPIRGKQYAELQVENRGFFTKKEVKIMFRDLPSGITVNVSPEDQILKAHNIATYGLSFEVNESIPAGTYPISMIAYGDSGIFDVIELELVMV
jgi:hypothetical protein